MKKQGLKIKVNALIQSFNVHTGKINKETRVHNLVVNTGLERVAHLIGGLSSDFFEYVAIGTSSTAVNASQVSLLAEVKRAAVTPTDNGNGIILYDHTFTFGTGESYTIREYGIFDTTGASAGTMFNRLIDGGHAVDIDNSIRVRITVTVVNS